MCSKDRGESQNFSAPCTEFYGPVKDLKNVSPVYVSQFSIWLLSRVMSWQAHHESDKYDLGGQFLKLRQFNICSKTWFTNFNKFVEFRVKEGEPIFPAKRISLDIGPAIGQQRVPFFEEGHNLLLSTGVLR